MARENRKVEVQRKGGGGESVGWVLGGEDVVGPWLVRRVGSHAAWLK